MEAVIRIQDVEPDIESGYRRGSSIPIPSSRGFSVRAALREMPIDHDILQPLQERLDDDGLPDFLERLYRLMADSTTRPIGTGVAARASGFLLSSLSLAVSTAMGLELLLRAASMKRRWMPDPSSMRLPSPNRSHGIPRSSVASTIALVLNVFSHWPVLIMRLDLEDLAGRRVTKFRGSLDDYWPGDGANALGFHRLARDRAIASPAKEFAHFGVAAVVLFPAEELEDMETTIAGGGVEVARMLPPCTAMGSWVRKRKLPGSGWSSFWKI